MRFTFASVFLLNSIFNLREKLQISKGDEEKPFLHHLEELRKMLFRMILCLLVTTVLCFVFAQDLMKIIRYPADRIWEIHESSHLVANLTSNEWNDAKKLAYTLGGADRKVREEALKRIPDKERELIEAATILRVARELPSDARPDFIRESATSPQVAEWATQLDEAGALLNEDGGRETMKMMGSFHPSEPFMLSMKLAFYAGIIISSPFLLYLILQFIVPGLLENERKLLFKSLACGVGLFLTGILFAYFIVLPRVLVFFYEYSLDFGISNEWRIGYYVSFATQLILMFGVAFELPIVVYPFIKLGVLTYDLMRSTRRYAIIAIAVLSAIVTPTPDAFTMMLMAVPMYALYEFCILLAWREGKRRRQDEEDNVRRTDEAYGLNDSEEHE